jgi:DNA-binding NarL/FixJ family response regulator/class 3 adenylate cyclase
LAELPSGTVTFLFTDIEGSTRLLRELGDRYASVLSEHQSLLRQSFAEHGGIEVDQQGDAFFAVFERARDAVACAAAGQRALASTAWPGGAEVWVRMGMHTGEPTVSGQRYVGLGVHRAARICAAARGGQVLLSRATASLLDEEELTGVALRAAGERDLKDFERPERVFELLIEGLPERPASAGAPGTPPQTEPEGSIGDALRVVVADDSVLLREGVCRLLVDAGFEVVGQAGDAEELLRLAREQDPDVAVVDIRMPPTHTDEGLRAARQLRAELPDVGVLVLSQYVDAGSAIELLSETQDGIGYLLKDRVADIEDFAESVRRVARGGTALDAAVVGQLVGRRRVRDPLADLTPRERDVMQLMAQGHDNEAIAARLRITPRAVAMIANDLIGKLSLSASAEDHRRVLELLTLLGAD